MPTSLKADVLIFGGGIAGLWTLARLRSLGYSCLLVEPHALGAGQTIASQGIIHGGLKYALDGQVGGAARAIAAMPGVWRRCLAGEKDAPVDLRGVPVLSDHYHYWTSSGVLSRMAGAGASRVMRTDVERLAPADRPELLRAAPTGVGGVDVYRVGEMVLDARMLVARLAELGRGRLVHGALVPSEDLKRAPGQVRLRCTDGREVTVRAQTVVLAAGAGNEHLLEAFGGPGTGEGGFLRMQRRPLHMVMLRGAPAELFGHCVGTSTSPRLTITSGRISVPVGTAAGEPEHVWYMGGQIAEAGVERSREKQIEAAKRELAECVPWVKVPSEARWATLMVDRAEGVRGGAEANKRPDGPAVVRTRTAIAAWPTKLAFAPLMADEVVALLGEMRVLPRADSSLDPPVPCAPPIALHIWDREGIVWS